MSLVLDALKGKRESVAFGGLVARVRENPKNIESWISLVDRLRHQAATGSTHDYSKGWHQEAWDVCKKATETNPNNFKLKVYVEEYKQFLEVFDYSIK